jgi:hypothetical protein
VLNSEFRSANSGEHQVISAAMKTITTSDSIAHMSASAITSASSGRPQVILAGTKTASSLHGITAGAGDHHQRSIANISALAITSASSEDHQVTTTAMKSTSSLHVISAGAGDHHQLRQVLGGADKHTHEKSSLDRSQRCVNGVRCGKVSSP